MINTLNVDETWKVTNVWFVFVFVQWTTSLLNPSEQYYKSEAYMEFVAYYHQRIWNSEYMVT